MEIRELTESPRNLFLPKNMTWPKPVLKEMEQWDTVYLEWDEANATLEEKVSALKRAKETDGQALADAVAQKKPDPGTKASDNAEREIVYWSEVCRQARRKADQHAARLWAVIEDHRESLIRDACERARQGAAKFADDMATVSAAGAKAIDDRRDGYDGLRFVSRLVGSALTYDPSFPVEGSVSVPSTHENRPLGIVTLLEKTLEREELAESA